jgi:tRNA (mo5U34)-methyltransferase
VSNHLSSQELEGLIAEAPYWHHRIELAPGIFTPGMQDTQALLLQVSFPEDLSGKRVLDIGARDGFFSFEAERRGASEVVALDNVPPHLTGFNVAHKILDSNVKWITGNVYDVNPSDLGHFDLVLFLGVIYHLRHPLLALDRIYEIVSESGELIIESHVIDGGLVDKSGNWRNLKDYHEELPNLALAQFYPKSELGNDETSKWAPNLTGLCGWVDAAGFDVTNKWSVAFRGGITASKRQIPEHNAKRVDAAQEWDLVQWHVTKDGSAL